MDCSASPAALSCCAPRANLQTASLLSARGPDIVVTCRACCRGLKQVAHLKIAPERREEAELDSSHSSHSKASRARPALAPR